MALDSFRKIVAAVCFTTTMLVTPCLITPYHEGFAEKGLLRKARSTRMSLTSVDRARGAVNLVATAL